MLRYATGPVPPTCARLLFCLVAVVVVGRTLLAYRPEQQCRERRWTALAYRAYRSCAASLAARDGSRRFDGPWWVSRAQRTTTRSVTARWFGVVSGAVMVLDPSVGSRREPPCGASPAEDVVPTPAREIPAPTRRYRFDPHPPTALADRRARAKAEIAVRDARCVCENTGDASDAAGAATDGSHPHAGATSGTKRATPLSVDMPRAFLREWPNVLSADCAERSMKQVERMLRKCESPTDESSGFYDWYMAERNAGCGSGEVDGGGSARVGVREDGHHFEDGRLVLYIWSDLHGLWECNNRWQRQRRARGESGAPVLTHGLRLLAWMQCWHLLREPVWIGGTDRHAAEPNGKPSRCVCASLGRPPPIAAVVVVVACSAQPELVEFARRVYGNKPGGMPRSAVSAWYKKNTTNALPPSMHGSRFGNADDDLQVCHIVPRALGGSDFIYNYVICTADVNRHFGRYFTTEWTKCVGRDAVQIACMFQRWTCKKAAALIDAGQFDPVADRVLAI